ncbi:hypothetical protein MHUMG1_05118 [Metarhizium humberi]|uniref:Uncharacterized protein n=1 Tax=Metarhizium humberi TaxID=2596975 RepID=A0A9P8MAL4_9HYPO|nr:hypothetical protein MHUMG1_05118 [Metarhizium humberi]
MVRLPRCQVVARLVGRGRKAWVVIEADPDAADASKLPCPVEAIVRPSISIGTLLLALDAQDTQLRVKSIQTYERASCEVAKALKGADWYQRDGLMATARLLSFYEGHEKADEPLCKAMAQIGERQQSPLSTHEWTDGAMDMHPKSVKDEVIDLGQKLPAIPEQVMAFRALGRVGATKHLEMRIITPCLDILTTRKQTGFTGTKEDAGISLLHLSEIYWIALMMLYLVLDFSTERQNGHNPRGTEQVQTLMPRSAYTRYTFTWSSIMERIAGLLASSFAIRCYLLGEKSTEHSSDERDVLQQILHIKPYGSEVRSPGPGR